MATNLANRWFLSLGMRLLRKEELVYCLVFTVRRGSSWKSVEWHLCNWTDCKIEGGDGRDGIGQRHLMNGADGVSSGPCGTDTTTRERDKHKNIFANNKRHISAHWYGLCMANCDLQPIQMWPCPTVRCRSNSKQLLIWRIAFLRGSTFQVSMSDATLFCFNLCISWENGLNLANC